MENGSLKSSYLDNPTQKSYPKWKILPKMAHCIIINPYPERFLAILGIGFSITFHDLLDIYHTLVGG